MVAFELLYLYCGKFILISNKNNYLISRVSVAISRSINQGCYVVTLQLYLKQLGFSVQNRKKFGIFGSVSVW